MNSSLSRKVVAPLVTPFKEGSFAIDWPALEWLVNYLVASGVTIFAGATTGEVFSLSRDERERLIRRVVELVDGRTQVFAGCGAPSTREALRYTKTAVDAEVDAIILMNPPFTQPPSRLIVERYLAPILRDNPDMPFFSYTFPATACRLEPIDLARLAHEFPNLVGIKQGDGNEDDMMVIRANAPEDFLIFSGPTNKTLRVMTDPKIRADGVVSGHVNLFPGALLKLCDRLVAGDMIEAQKIQKWLNILDEVATIKVTRPDGVIEVYPALISIKMTMAGLGMIPSPCLRYPLDVLPVEEIAKVRIALQQVQEGAPWIMRPIEESFGVSIKERLANDKLWKGLAAR